MLEDNYNQLIHGLTNLLMNNCDQHAFCSLSYALALYNEAETDKIKNVLDNNKILDVLLKYFPGYKDVYSNLQKIKNGSSNITEGYRREDEFRKQLFGMIQKDILLIEEFTRLNMIEDLFAISQ